MTGAYKGAAMNGGKAMKSMTSLRGTSNPQGGTALFYTLKK
jgi:hypothetical protein